ncbi:TetR/AcrR family transcriptional regulator [Leifsonia aquatica]|uniref:TetR/AcrR family transcriptional regulator n=1 Tax=Leifsonia aquatica TaxID=144185 RepID=UPI0028AE7F3B|nr:TetR/AcrR family transcriptional regulator [Leifsonia aquatica]
MRERKTAEILAAARELFLRDGYAGTTIEAIAASAGVSKATVYSNFADKDALFVELLEVVTGEAGGILRSATAGLEGDGPLRDRFLAVAGVLVRGVLRPEVVSLRRLAISQAVRFPEAAAGYWRAGPAATIDLLADRFRSLADEGVLAASDPARAAAQFAYALVGPLQDRLLLDPGHTFTDTDLEAHIAATVDAFLRGYGAAAGPLREV